MNNILHNWPQQVSTNLYQDKKYEMVPHKDGYSNEACIVSLGSATLLEFWKLPMTEQEKELRKMLVGRFSGTEVLKSLVDKESDIQIFMEPGSALVLSGESLQDFAHGLRPKLIDFHNVISKCANIRAVSNIQLVNSTLLNSDEDKKIHNEIDLPPKFIVERNERVSIVLWTPYTSK